MFTSLIPLLLALTSCGGGGGGSGDSFVGAASINMSLSPNTIDTNDRARVSIRIENVIDTGILLKVRYSPKISFAAGTAELKLDTEDLATKVVPSVMAETSDYKYLVFFLGRNQFGDVPADGETLLSTPATLTFEITGDKKLTDGKIEADADVNDPAIPDATEFNINKPGLEPTTDASINVL